MPKLKATHIGTCQACGSIQKLPDGRLSNHPYDIQWHFFKGICRGARELPYEQDYSLIQKFIDWAQKDKEGVEAAIARYLAPATEPKAWFNEYIIAETRRERSGYKWNQVELRQVIRAYPSGGRYTGVVFVDYKGNEQGLRRHGYYGDDTNLLIIATDLNIKYVEQVLRPTVEKLDRYIVWQQQRITDWNLTELKPVPPEVKPDPNRKPRRRKW